MTARVKMGNGALVDKGILVVDTKKGKRYIRDVMLVPELDKNLPSGWTNDGKWVLFVVW